MARPFTSEWDRILSTPGASTDASRDFTGSHPKNKPVKTFKETLMPAPETVAVESTAEIDQLCADLNYVLNDTTLFVTLLGPETLTVEKVKGYSKVPHIGGEDFHPRSAYVGKRGTIIVKFAPADAQPYQFMEMEVRQAMTSPANFPSWCDNPETGLFLTKRLREINTAASNERERVAVKDKFDLYDNFGTF